MRGLLCLLLLAGAVRSALPDTVEAEQRNARRILKASIEAYRAVPAFRDQLTYAVVAPGAEQETKMQEYGFGPKGSVYIKNALLQAVAVDGKLYLTQSDVPDRYVAAPYDGDLGAVLRRVAGRGSLFEPPPLAMHAGKSLDNCIDTLRFNLLEPLQIAGYRHSDNGTDVIHFTAGNGSLDLVIDSTTHFLQSISFEVRPSGAPAGMLVRVTGTFSPQIIPASELQISFDPANRSAVTNLTDLTSSRLTAGLPAPDFELQTLDGKRVSLNSLRGSIVVLDFWATWCVPCWTALKESQALSDWAAANKLEMRVLAVNTMEQGSEAAARLDRVTAFWKAQKLTMPTLVDTDSKVFASYGHPGLPSVVIISRDERILRYHEGLIPNLAETLKKEIAEAR